MRKHLVWVSIGSILVILGFGGWWTLSKVTPIDGESTLANEASQDETPKELMQSQTIRLIATGDMLPHDTVNLRAEKNGSYDYAQFFESVKPIMDSADLTFCNQESPSGGSEFGITGYPSFNAPTEFARDLSLVGCNIISLANNHMGDKGNPALDKTLEIWDRYNPLAVSGANANADDQKVKYFTVAEKTFAFVAFTDHENRSLSDTKINKLRDPLAKNMVKEARKKADFVIISAHWGSENTDGRLIDSQRTWANKLADYGADVVFGHGPHVIQEYTEIKNDSRTTYVWYSLGNMLSTQLKTDELFGGFAVVDLGISPNGILEVSRTALIPTYMHYEWTANEKARTELLARKNLMIYPLHDAKAPLSRSQLKVTVTEALARIKKAAGDDLAILSFDQL